jgi:hypothetical protein
MASRDANGEFLDGADRYRISRPAGFPKSRFWYGILRLYRPLQPFLDKIWRASEIEPSSPGSNAHDPATDAEPRARASGARR